MAKKKAWNKAALSVHHSLEFSQYKIGDIVLFIGGKKWWPGRVHSRAENGLNVTYCGFKFE